MGIKSEVYFTGPNQVDLAQTLELGRLNYVEDLFGNSPYTISCVDEIQIELNDFY